MSNRHLDRPASACQPRGMKRIGMVGLVRMGGAMPARLSAWLLGREPIAEYTEAKAVWIETREAPALGFGRRPDLV